MNRGSRARSLTHAPYERVVGRLVLDVRNDAARHDPQRPDASKRSAPGCRRRHGARPRARSTLTTPDIARRGRQQVARRRARGDAHAAHAAPAPGG